MNDDLLERWGRSGRPKQHTTRRPEADVVQMWIQPSKLNPRILRYYEDSKLPAEGGSWLARPAVPTSAEVLDCDEGAGSDSNSSGFVPLAANRPTGQWKSKGHSRARRRSAIRTYTSAEEYLRVQYGLLREDAVRPLRDAVSTVRITPDAVEETFNGSVGIYDKVRVCGFICSPSGFAITVTFSTQRAGKRILWEQSKRLVSGSLVALTPVRDMFRTVAIVATVAGRPISGLLQNPPEIDLFVARAEELEIDPAEEWVMVQDRVSFFEGQKHTLLALQKMAKEEFPFQEHLVRAETSVGPPKYLDGNSIKDLTSVFINNKHETYNSVDILHNWPSQPPSTLDSSQTRALQRILTKRLAIVQGPPGTGKTYISVQAIKILLSNRRRDDPPIIVTCQTNHALDQLLCHIAEFESDFARVGGQSKDEKVIKPRTVYELSQVKLKQEHPPAGCSDGKAKTKMGKLQKEIEGLLLPLSISDAPFDHQKLQEFGILSEAQVRSLEAGASQWVHTDFYHTPAQTQHPFSVWLGQSLLPVRHKPAHGDTGFDYEETDLDFEQLRDQEAENAPRDNDEFETLHGQHFALAENFTCSKIPSASPGIVEGMLTRYNDLWEIPEHARGTLYLYLLEAAKKRIRDEVRIRVKQYDEAAALRRIGKWEKMHEPVLVEQKIIGMTTTGFSKYRALITALQPRIVLIEEAGETLEAPVIATCAPSVEHLVLVGDHQQLRPHCQVKEHEDEPYHLNMSLFERLVNNKVEFDTLTKQRRMIPEIRRLLYPIYKNTIEDHKSVTVAAKRPPVPGMGGVNTLFHTHKWPERRDELMSVVNHGEADMILGFLRHLIFNNVEPEKITVLTFYNGQRKLLLKQLRKHEELYRYRFEVVTVDSYQGEENDIVILSLVRSNPHNSIGFLNVDNRVCVALSRAKRGFYLFGDAQMLFDASKTWHNVLLIMLGQKNKADAPQVPPKIRVVTEFLICCTRHGNVVEIETSEDWQETHGGCKLPCASLLPCGHICKLNCHPFDEDLVNCRQPCEKVLSCGHKCNKACGDKDHACGVCGKRKPPIAMAPAREDRVLSGEGSALQKSTYLPAWLSHAQSEASGYATSTASAQASSTPNNPRGVGSTGKLPAGWAIGQMKTKMQQLNMGVDGGCKSTGRSNVVLSTDKSDGKQEKLYNGHTPKDPSSVEEKEELLIDFD